MVLSLCHMCSRGSYLNEKGMHLSHGLTWLCELSFFLHTVFIFVRSESCHIYTTSFQPFSVVILEKQPTQSKNWFWETSKPPNPSAKPPSGQSGGPSGVWLRLSTVVFAWWLESKIKWQKELSSFTDKIPIKVWGSELSSVLIVLHNATENEGVFLKYQSFNSVHFWFSR